MPSRSSAAEPVAPSFEAHEPGPALRDVVDHYWIMRTHPSPPFIGPVRIGTRPLVVVGPDGLGDESTPGFPADYRHLLVIPDGASEILTSLPYDRGSAYAFLMGPFHRTIDVSFRVPSIVFAIRFHAGAARDFVARAMHTLTNRPVPLEEVWGAIAADYVREASRTSTLGELAAIAERYLLSMRPQPNPTVAIVRRCTAMLERSHGLLPLEALQKETGLTERQIERLFREHVGLSPKRFARTVRLNYLLESVKNPESIDWHDLTVTLNYCDQPHLIREFRDFIGMSPASFRKELQRYYERTKGRRGGGSWWDEET